MREIAELWRWDESACCRSVPSVVQYPFATADTVDTENSTPESHGRTIAAAYYADSAVKQP